MARSLIRSCAACAIAALSAGPAPSAADAARVRLVPAEPPAWSAARTLASLRDGAREPRELRIETEPAGARLALAYVREGAEVARAEGEAPLVVLLPGRARVGPSDRLELRAMRDGFAPAELRVDPALAVPHVRIALTPLPRRLLAAALLDLGGRVRLTLTSDRPLDARLAETVSGTRLVLANVAVDAELVARLEALRGTPISRVDVRPVGSDLLVELIRAPDEVRAPRLTRRDETVRQASHLALDWLPEDQGAAALRAADRALSAAVLDACAEAFEGALLSTLGRESLARALAPNDGFTDAYVALALGRLAGGSPGGELAMRDGARLALDGDTARAFAHARAADVRGAIAAVRSVAEALAPAGGSEPALHAWLAPEIAPAAFHAAYAQAAQAEGVCRATRP